MPMQMATALAKAGIGIFERRTFAESGVMQLGQALACVDQFPDRVREDGTTIQGLIPQLTDAWRWMGNFVCGRL